MNRRSSFATIAKLWSTFSLLALFATACGSSATPAERVTTSLPSGAADITTTSATATGSVAITTTSLAVVALPDICPLADKPEITALLGAVPEGAGHQLRYEPTYDTCSFSGKPLGSGNSNSIDIGVVRKKTPKQLGFSEPHGFTSSKPVAGVGESAIFYATPGTDSTYTLQLSHGSLVLSIHASFQATSPKAETVEANLVAIARTMLRRLGS